MTRTSAPALPDGRLGSCVVFPDGASRRRRVGRRPLVFELVAVLEGTNAEHPRFRPPMDDVSDTAWGGVIGSVAFARKWDGRRFGRAHRTGPFRRCPESVDPEQAPRR